MERLPKWLRWLLLVPAAVLAGFVAATVVGLLPGAPGGGFGYVAAFASGLGYVLAALFTAHSFAPSHKPIAVAVLGVFIVGDLAVVHLVLPDLLPLAGPEPGFLKVLSTLLRADDYAELRGGGAVKVVGALVGLVLAWRFLVRGTRAGGSGSPD